MVLKILFGNRQHKNDTQIKAGVHKLVRSYGYSVFKSNFHSFAQKNCPIHAMLILCIISRSGICLDGGRRRIGYAEYNC